ncbi:Cyanate permease [Tistlia consotensis]|uniref:Cyanate permease n=1 Tax=Tistlia consotensis USBA 355 TaxID=560819 RepID=A0A1Y6BJA5_9PROT|nr:MFS transporter [Tistlia consotensis]SMF13969.1 Cyanate permease [Tistlia consotensis USBA 355]SNR50012.1 Cyanate permease [Tistlia consotensis]
MTAPDPIPHPPLEQAGRFERPLDAARRRRGLVAVLTSILAAGLTFGTAIPLIALLLERRGTATWLIGLNAATPIVATLLMGFLLPVLLRRVRALPLLLCGLALIVVCFLLMSQFRQIEAWFVLRFLVGLGMAVHWIVSETWLNALAPKSSRGLLAGLYATLMSIGFAAGPALLTLVDLEGFAPFGFISLTVALAALPLLCVGDAAPTVEAHGEHSRWSAILVAPTVFAATVVSGVMDSSVLSLLAIYGLRIGLPQDQAVLMLSVAVAGTVFLQVPLGWLSDHLDRRAMLLACGAVGGAGALALPFVAGQPLLLWPLLFVWGGVFVGLYTVALAMLGERFQGGALAQANALFVMVYCLGNLSGPPLAGAAMDWVGPNGLPAIMTAVCSLFLLLGLARTPFVRPRR